MIKRCHEVCALGLAKLLVSQALWRRKVEDSYTQFFGLWKACLGAREVRLWGEVLSLQRFDRGFVVFFWLSYS